MPNSVRCARALPQTWQSFFFKTVQPFVSSHSTHFIARTKGGETPPCTFVLRNEHHPLFQGLVFLPGHNRRTVSEVAGLFCKGCCRFEHRPRPRLLAARRLGSGGRGRPRPGLLRFVNWPWANPSRCTSSWTYAAFPFSIG